MAGLQRKAGSGLFISYRRADSRPWAGRLSADLRRHVGVDRVYLDVDSNRVAADYRAQIEEALDAARIALVLIGPGWLSAEDATGAHRLRDPDDLVRLEVERVLSTGIACVPVLVGGARMPAPDDLPDSLRALSPMHAARMSDEDWAYDLGRLLESFERHGLHARSTREDERDRDRPSPVAARRYERTLRASRRRLLDCVIGAVEALGYADLAVDAGAGVVSFAAIRRRVDVAVVDAEHGSAIVVVEFASVRTSVGAAGSLALGISTGGMGFAALPALRAWERRFAKGFLDNVQRVHEGRGIGEDSAVPRGLSDLRKRKREV